MPIYEYRCPNGHLFELIQRMDDAQPEVCEICGEGPVERVLYPVAVHFKGSGFYTTDYGRGKRSKGDESKDKDGAKPETKESKPEKKEKAAEA
ncbi:MAG: zinc ribbon domain-containing protein [Actinobacteria bacterium]|nr:MAG: zinc ribbon domain-containing protein [Actinomycetota bacterium]